MACFSFHPRKVLTTGEGGMVTDRRREIAARIRRLRQHAMGTSDLARHKSQSVMVETYDEVGLQLPHDRHASGLGLVQLDRVEGFIARRRAVAA